VAPNFGACSTMWTFHYEEYYPSDPFFDQAVAAGTIPSSSQYYAVNHEIDIEMPGRDNQADRTNIAFNKALCNTWVGETSSEYVAKFTNLSGNQNDGNWHKYAFEWHTGGNGQTAKVDFYVDDVKVQTSTTYIPNLASRLWVAVWFPDGWAGNPNFNTSILEVDYVRITPYLEPNDRWQSESFENDGWVGSFAMPSKITTPFYDNFDNGLDPAKWLIAKKNWGGQRGALNSFNGGVSPENVKLRNGNLILEGHGDWYKGKVAGINKYQKINSFKRDGKKCGAAIATTEYFASGKYEVTMKVAPNKGVCSAIWTFFYQEIETPNPPYFSVINHEIDIEMPGRDNQNDRTNISFNKALCNTWIGENSGEYIAKFTDLGFAQNDGNFHKYTLEWHTNPKSVKFYVDDVLKQTNTEYVPTRSSRLWIAAWFPNEWAGVPNFNVSELEISEVKITPYHESGDEFMPESYRMEGWASDYEYPVLAGQTGTPAPTNTPTPTPTPTATPVATVTPAATPTATPLAGNLVVNGNFSSNFTGWTQIAGSSIYNEAGNNRAQLTATSSTTARVEQTITGLLTNTTYRLSAIYKTDAGIYGYFGVQDFGGSPAEVGGISSSGYDSSKYITFTTGASNTSAKIYLQVWKQQSGSAYFDDVVMIKQ
jgi:hypothetical protein